ncbi:unnamed protein product [Auanema sp. JU1783]|nr:unnamed protein product [Auanema sp. JU1783]
MTKKRNRSSNIKRSKTKKEKAIFEVDKNDLFSNISSEEGTPNSERKSSSAGSSIVGSVQDSTSSLPSPTDSEKDSELEYRAVAYVQLAILEGNLENLHLSESKKDMKKTFQTFRDYLHKDLEDL